MTWMKWLPWRFIVRRVAHSHGFLDPIAVLARLRGFAQPSEVGEPSELLRAGVVFHARGLINSKVVQHNLDWVWPYWIERQFDPQDPSFIPRAFSITHINLTHRNWTAIGYPDCPELPIVDPRGLLTPLLDGWSLDGWVLADDGRCLLPSRASACQQTLNLEHGVSVTTHTRAGGLSLRSHASVPLDEGAAVCQLRLSAETDEDAWIVLSLRPQNPEGVSFIHQLQLSDERTAWQIDDTCTVHFNSPAERHHVSDYAKGDVHIHLFDLDDQQAGICDVGLVTAAAMFRVQAGQPREVVASIPLDSASNPSLSPIAWEEIQHQQCQLQCPESRFQFLYDAALASLALHSPDDVYPGPYTYKRFWFRDAAFIIHALLCAGLTERAKRALERFPERQTLQGYFRSQEGEWDSNGEALWILRRYTELSGESLEPHWNKPIKRGAEWIVNKRMKGRKALNTPHDGLLPAGFSAEHLGNNDYYYWDDFWGIAGLNAAAYLLDESAPADTDRFVAESEDFMAAVDRSVATAQQRLRRSAIPASPYRRMDAGAIGSLAVGYPLQLCEPDDVRLLDTVEYLLENCFVKGAFFQDMIHSGLNAYLTLHVAQILLRAGDARYLSLMDAVADLATSTGQWPEAIHPQTGGGCMGDGHHVWAAAEWLLMIRHCFVREEKDKLVLVPGIPTRWLDAGTPIAFGPAPTRFGSLSLHIVPESSERVHVSWQAEWYAEPPRIEVQLPGFGTERLEGEESLVVVQKSSS